MEEQLVKSIHWSLDNHLLDNALFMAERLVAQRSNAITTSMGVTTAIDEEAHHLLALCHFRRGKHKKALSIVKRCSSPENRYLLALCALQLNLLNEAEFALTGGKNDLDSVPNGSAGLLLLGQIARKQNQIPKATKYFKKSLESNPFLWSAYEALCDLGDNTDASVYFGAATESIATPSAHNQPPISLGPPGVPMADPPRAAQAAKPTTTLDAQDTEGQEAKSLLSTPALARRLISSSLFSPAQSLFSPTTPANPPNPTNLLSRFAAPTPSPFAGPTKSRVAKGGIVPHPFELPTATPNPVRHTAASGSAPVEAQTPQASMPPPEIKPVKRQPAPVKVGKTTTTSAATTATSQTPRRSARLGEPAGPGGAQAPTKNRVKKTGADATKGTPGPVKKPTRLFRALSEPTVDKTPGPSTAEPTAEIPARGGPVAAAFQASEEATQAADGTVALLTLLREIGNAYRDLSQFNCQAAIAAFKSLPSHQLQTSWVLANIGKAYFELCDYAKACDYFEQVRVIEPWATRAMEYFSTSLWHLKREMEMSFLGNQLADYDTDCPETWCSVGNSFSLQKEHDTALKFFQRATQVDPHCAYAYTLAGHEYISMDNWDKAIVQFRNAIRLDPRHYNAWYGLGMCHFRQERFDFAEYHFRRACLINPQSASLRCYIGMVLLAQAKFPAALHEFNQSLALEPKHYLARYKHVVALCRLGQYKNAHEELEEFIAHSPREVPLHFLMGKIEKHLGAVEKALTSFTTAMDLDSKSSTAIKIAIDSVAKPDDPSDSQLELFL